MSTERLVELMSTDGVWRVGRKVKRTVYVGEVLVGLMDTPALAEQVVTAVNAAQPPPAVEVAADELTTTGEMVMLPPPPPVNHWIKAYVFSDGDQPGDEPYLTWEPLNKEPFNWRCVQGIRHGLTEDWAKIVCAATRYEWLLRHGE